MIALPLYGYMDIYLGRYTEGILTVLPALTPAEIIAENFQDSSFLSLAVQPWRLPCLLAALSSSTKLI